MKKNDRGIPLFLVIIFVLLGLGIINAGIHDIIFFGDYEDAVAIPVGLIFALPPLFLYFKGNKKQDLTPLEREMRNSKRVLYLFIIIHVLVLSLFFFSSTNKGPGMPIVIFYCVAMIVYCVYKLHKIKTNPNSMNQIKYKNFSTHESITVNMYDENGELKSRDQIRYEIESQREQNRIESQTNSNSQYDNNTVLSYKAPELDESYNDPEYDEPFKERNINRINPNEMRNIVNKFGAIWTIVGGVFWIVICYFMFYMPKFTEETVPADYYINGVQVTREQFYSDPNGWIFILFGVFAIIVGIIMLIKSNKK